MCAESMGKLAVQAYPLYLQMIPNTSHHSVALNHGPVPRQLIAQVAL